MKLDASEIQRYSRQILIPGFGLEGQQKLKESSVLVIGCGGLGSPVLMYLAAAGIGRIGLVEDDKIDTSNLQRQILYNEDVVGLEKIEEAAKRLEGINGNVIIEKYNTRLSSKNALSIVEKYDVVVDGSDNFPTRYLLNDSCVLRNKPLVYGAIYRFEGQVSVFNYDRAVNYRDLFPNPPSEDMAPNCATAGVLGMMAGIIGTLQATEVVKILTGMGEVLSGKLLLVEALNMNFRKVKILRNKGAKPITELIDYEKFCGLNNELTNSMSFSNYENQKSDIIQLIDVREESEYQADNLGGELMPLSEIEEYISQIKREGKVLVHCQSGQRSLRAIKLLQEEYGFTNLINLEGGLNAVYS
ncbi:molybdopterin-synthase adenylyltransferase MoeB [uncultured Arcticibacterium sp.]|uniref:molybdopterin-synthase adenylyltransferase MoeB n=1 Tax=uncultured Arcticibacterium sp. TaxID=2173042 RepID=UPI0030F61FE5